MRLPWFPLAAVTLGAMVLSGCSDGVSVSDCGPFDFSDVGDAGRRNLEVRTDRVIAGNGDHVCVRAKFYGEAPGGELRMKVAHDRKLVSLDSEKTGDGEWTAVWKPAGPGEWNVGAFFEGDESFVTGTSVEVGDAGGEFGDATVTGALRDRDGNGINDEIRIKVPVVIADSGEYDVVVTLKDRHGQEERAAERDFLGEGSHFVSMTIPVSRLGVRAVEEVEVVTAILIRFGDNDAYGQDEEPSLGFVKPE